MGGNTPDAIFTMFRCLSFDCSTAEGKSLIVGLSKGYGIIFDLGYILVSVFLVCGVMNVIMATFVQKTSDGLDSRETLFVQNRLKELSDRVYVQRRLSKSP